MPADETRRLLKVFGVAVTTLEDAVRNKASEEEIAEAEREARERLDDVSALISRLRAEGSVHR